MPFLPLTSYVSFINAMDLEFLWIGFALAENEDIEQGSEGKLWFPSPSPRMGKHWVLTGGSYIVL